MTPDRSESRFEEVTRRAFLRRTAALGTAVLLPGVIVTACGGDVDAFASSSSGATAGASAATTTTLAGTTTSSTVETTTAPAAQGVPLPSTAQMSIDFTYAATSDGGAVRNPYVAVWVEDADGELVKTLGLWFLQSEKGLRWLNELRRWDSVDGSSSSIETISSATRTPGDYSLLWDMTDMDGTRVTSGEFFVCIEAAREHGPYSLIREQLTIGNDGLVLGLADGGELTDATVTYVV